MPVPHHNPITIATRVLLTLVICAVILLLGRTPFAEEGEQKKLSPFERMSAQIDVKKTDILYDEADDFDTGETENSPQVVARKQLLTGQLFRNRRDQIHLSRAREALRKGNDELALQRMQHMLDMKSDQFVWYAPSLSISSLRKEVDHLMRLRGNKLLQIYEEKYGADAKRLLHDAKTSNDFLKYHEVAQRFFFTKAGFTAVNHIATQQQDRGYFGVAARMWGELIASKGHQQRISSTFILKTAITYQLAGNNEAAFQTVKLMGRQPAYLGKQKLYKTDAIALLQSNRFVPEQQELATDWKISGGSPLRHRLSKVSAPFLKANWVNQFNLEKNQSLGEYLSDWKEQQQAAMKPTAVQSNVIVAGDKLIMRTLRGIECRQLSTGKLIWQFRHMISPDNNRGRQSIKMQHLAMISLFAGSGCLGNVSASEQSVYAIDDLQYLSSLDDPRRSNTRSLRIRNRLIALSLTPENSNRSTVRPLLKWSIGGKSQVPLWFYRNDRNGNRLVSQQEFTGSKERFLKLDSDSDQLISQTEAIAGSPQTKIHPLANHLFLGPPLPVGDRLFVMTYFEDLISLSILHAETGHLISQQGMVLLPGAVSDHVKRLSQGIEMAYADGIVVCPVFPDLLVGVDATRGKLLWVSDKLSGTTPDIYGRRTMFINQESQTHSGYPAMPLIEGNRIYHLPRISNNIYCFDLKTGKKIWTAPRDGAEYIGAITEKTLFVVGNRYYKSLHKTTGKTVWQKLTTIPSGRGVFTGKHYLLPLQAGRVATIDVSSGKKLGFAMLPDNPLNNNEQTTTYQNRTPRWSPGNLIAAGGQIISTNLHEAAIFPEVNLLRQQLAQKKIQSALSPRDHLVLAELDLLSGNTQGSRTELKSLAVKHLNPAQAARARKILREILYLDLKQPSGDSNSILTLLDRLSITPIERGRYLMQKGEIHLQQKDFAGLMRTTTEYARLPRTDLLPVDDDPTILISARSWIPRIINRAKRQLGTTAVRQNLLFASKEMEQVLTSNNPERLEQFLSVYGNWTEVAVVRSQLAQLVLKQGEYQRAEFLLLKNHHNHNRQIAADATYQLLKLYQQLGLQSDAARMLALIDKKYQTVTLPVGVTGNVFVRQYPRQSLVWNQYQQQQLFTWKIKRVAVTGKGWLDCDPELKQTFSSYRRIIPMPAASPFTLLEKRQGGSNRLTVIDRATGVVKGQIWTQSKNQYPQLHHFPTEGHFFPVAGYPGREKIGVSLLHLQNSQPLWRKSSKYYSAGTAFRRAGPSGLSFTTFQSSHQLVVLDPATGHVLWNRKELPRQSGLFSNSTFGLIGDENVLVLFYGSSQNNYIIYNTQTGEEMRKGSLPRYSSFRPYVFGRKLLFQKRLANGAGGQLVLWDSIDNHDLLSQFLPSPSEEEEIPLEPKSKLYRIALTPEKELVFLEGELLRILDVQSQKLKVTVKLQSSDLSSMQYLRVFQQGGVYFVNIQKSNHGNIRFGRFGRRNSSRLYRRYHASDTLIPATHIQGELIAVDAKTSKILWKQTINPISILQTAHYQLPFLIGLSRLRDGRIGNQESLSVEVIDVRTGERIGENHNIISDRIVQLTYNMEAKRIELYGLKTRIDLDFSPQQQRLAD